MYYTGPRKATKTLKRNRTAIIRAQEQRAGADLPLFTAPAPVFT